ncbi:MAG: hypothetical protein PVG73_03680 [Desulfobacterales bacterium]
MGSKKEKRFFPEIAPCGPVRSNISVFMPNIRNMKNTTPPGENSADRWESPG